MSAALEDKVAIVTGAGSGLGRAVAVGFAAAGAAVVANDIVDGPGLRETVAAIVDGGGGARPHVGDVSRREDVAAMIELATSTFGGLDVMHANAAVGVYSELETMAPADLDRIVDVNLRGPLLCAQAAIPAMRARGGGSIVFVSSAQAYLGLHGDVVYAAAKAGLVAAARTLAVEVGPAGIRVNALVPGTIETPMFQMGLDLAPPQEREAALRAMQAANALRRIGRDDEIAAAAVFLASDASSYTTGSPLFVDGGYLGVKRWPGRPGG